MNRINWFGFIFISPVLIMVLLFFLTPVVMTAFFSFTNMSTSTGIKGGEYLINQETIKEIKKYNIQKDTIEKLENAGYSINEEGLKIVSEKYKESLSNEIKSW
jgi:inositol-phosphate transport system permease protein